MSSLIINSPQSVQIFPTGDNRSPVQVQSCLLEKAHLIKMVIIRKVTWGQGSLGRGGDCLGGVECNYVVWRSLEISG